MIKITLPGEPIPKMRPRFSKKGTYDLQSSQKHAYKFQILSQVNKYPFIPFMCPVAIEIEMDFYFPIPKGEENLYSWGILEHTKKPDTDNLQKWVLDCMSGIVFEDDRQVNITHSQKKYSDNPRTEIFIMPKQPIASDQVKELLSMVPSDQFCDLAASLSVIADWFTVNGLENPGDYDEVAFLILEFAEKHADTLKKINKKFPDLAKVLKEKLENK